MRLMDTRTRPRRALQAMLQDFYLALLPRPSQFELPPGATNGGLYVHELQRRAAVAAARRVALGAAACGGVVLLAALRVVLARRRLERASGRDE